jgi:hypothetical protein
VAAVRRDDTEARGLETVYGIHAPLPDPLPEGERGI